VMRLGYAHYILGVKRFYASTLSIGNEAESGRGASGRARRVRVRRTALRNVAESPRN